MSGLDGTTTLLDDLRAVRAGGLLSEADVVIAIDASTDGDDDH